MVGDAGTIAAQMADAAGALMTSLDAEATRSLKLPFDDAERTTWSYYPRETAGAEHVGLPLYDLTMNQRTHVMRLVRLGLSHHGFAQVNTIMAMETVLDALEDYALSPYRDPTRYWLAIYGEPAPVGSWAWSFEGHHVSIHHTVFDGMVVASTPLFLGAHPARTTYRGRDVMRPCAAEEEIARELFTTLDESQRANALLNPVPPIDIVLTDVSSVPPTAEIGFRDHPLDEMQAEIDMMRDDHRADLALDLESPRGVAAADLTGDQRCTLSALVDVYLERLPETLSARETARIERAGRDLIHFAWAGSAKPGRAHYYRIHGPSFLVEYDCVQNRANHIHSVWRDPARDFGRDLLGAHLRREHR